MECRRTARPADDVSSARLPHLSRSCRASCRPIGPRRMGSMQTACSPPPPRRKRAANDGLSIASWSGGRERSVA